MTICPTSPMLGRGQVWDVEAIRADVWLACSCYSRDQHHMHAALRAMAGIRLRRSARQVQQQQSKTSLPSQVGCW